MPHLPRFLLPAGAAVIVAIAAVSHPDAQAPSAARLGTDAARSARPSPNVDVAGMDKSVRPGDDFFRYANGTWDRLTAIPADRSMWGIGAELDEQANAQTRALLEEAAKGGGSGDGRKAGEYFAAYMNEAAIEARGLASLKPRLDRIAAIATRRDLADALGAELRADVDPLNATNFHTDRLFGLWVAQDFNSPTHNIGYLLQGGLGMPDREYYVGQDQHMVDARTKYTAHIAAVLRLAHVAGADAKAQRVLDMETKIARVHWTREQSGDVHKANNPWTRADFDRKAPGLDWATYFKAAGLDDQRSFIVWQPSAITGEAALVASEPIDLWRDYLQFRTLDHWSGLLPKAFVTERFNFYGKVLSGTQQLADRWKRAMASTDAALGDAVGRLYVQRYFPPASKARVQAMVNDLKAAFARRIDALDWMSPQTKAKARQKLQALIVGVGYPDSWRDYSGLTITRDDALTNAMRAEAYEYQRNVKKLHSPIDRQEWWLTPQTENAVNLPIQNALNFPAAILQPPYFDPAADTAHNYGAIGAIIGHEISHSFDDQGSQFDASGKLANWWQPADFQHFKQASAKLVAQYNAYHPLPNVAVNGQQTLSENIADVAGLAAAYDAYRLSLQGKPAPTREGFTGDQLFFLSFAQSWRDKYREPLLRQILLTDGHSPSEYRADTVRNLDPWYAAFNVKADQQLYLAPGDRVRVW
jgi:putative endopeptidase